MSWRKVKSKSLINSKWLILNENSYVTESNGKIEPYYMLEYPDWINVVAIDDQANILLIRQYRPGADLVIPEIIAGGIEKNYKDPRDAAIREMSEEIGFLSGDIFATGVTFANPANQTNKIFSFLAINVKTSGLQHLEDNESIIIQRVPFKIFLQQIRKQDITLLPQALHLSSIFLSINFIMSTSDSKFSILKEIIQNYWLKK